MTKITTMRLILGLHPYTEVPHPTLTSILELRISSKKCGLREEKVGNTEKASETCESEKKKLEREVERERRAAQQLAIEKAEQEAAKAKATGIATKLDIEKTEQEEAETKVTATNKAQAEAGSLRRAENSEWPRAHLHGLYSFTCVGKRMMKTPFLKESPDENSDDEYERERREKETRSSSPSARSFSSSTWSG
ncbi:hypothetical protein FPHYL_13144 [Fusarium phyllophilum]|uniref:Uncharacterized protein n=1 Tax=Fusarium phyllophilum TaxID=47803 RepID=A0A8H5IJI7_9HYPO|nr:hypothetical protein FPHYL_13144 [Fusarium phyllophilum]